MEAQRDGVAALFGKAGELKATEAGAEARLISDALADRVTALVLELIGYDLSDRRGRLSDAAHFGRMVGLLEPTMPNFDPARSHPYAATALFYVAVQSEDADKLFEQLATWTLQAGYWLTRTGMDSHVLLGELRTELTALLAAVEPAVPQPRRATHDDVEVPAEVAEAPVEADAAKTDAAPAPGVAVPAV
jgi:hypothetical protein